MDQEGEIKSDVFMKQLPQVHLFVKHLTYYRCILRAKLAEKSEFFTVACNACLYVATIAWCNVFGSRKSDLHWSKTIRNIPEEIEQDFKDRVYRSTGLNEEEYRDYQSSIKTWRDEYVAHTDLNWEADIPIVPHFDNALTVAKEYERWVMELLPKEGSFYDGVFLEDIIETAEKKVVSLAALFSV